MSRGMDARASEGRSQQPELGGFFGWARRCWQGSRIALGILIAYVVLTVVMTYPVVSRLSTHVPGNPGDAFEHLWLLWWGKKAMWDLGSSMADLSYLNHPWGMYHPMLAVTPLLHITSVPFMLLFDPLVAYNLVFLSTFVLTAFTTYLLCYHITGSRVAAFAGGLIYGFAPTRMIHGIGHLAQIATYWFPLFALCLTRLVQRPTWRRGLWAGLLMGLSALVNFVHTFHFVLVFALCWLLYMFFARHRLLLSHRLLGPTAAMFGVGAAICAPFFVPYLLNEIRGTTHYLMPGGASGAATTPVSFLVPSLHNPLVEAVGLTDFVGELLKPNPVESWAYLGIVPIVLAVWGARRERLEAKFWLVYGMTSIALSMGPFLRLGEKLIVIDHIDGIDVYVPLPFILLRLFPFFKLSRTPARIAVGTPLALSVLVSLGMVQLGGWLRRRWNVRVMMVLPVLTAIILFEYCYAFPYPSTPAPIPEFYAQVQNEEGDFAILDYPLNVDDQGNGLAFNRALYYQTRHERPIAGGRTWRLVTESIGTTEVIKDLVSPTEQIRPKILAVERADGERVAWLSELGFRYLIQHKYLPEDFRPWKRRSLEQIETERQHFARFLEPVYEDEQIVAYAVPTDSALPADALPLAGLTYGWHAPGEGAQGVSRWMEQEGRAQAYSARNETYRLAFEAFAFDHPRELTLLVNGEPLYTTTVHGKRQFITPAISLQSGPNSLRFRATEPCERPIDVEVNSHDRRCLSIQFSQSAWVDANQVEGQPGSGTRFGGAFRLSGYDLSEQVVEQGGVVHLKLRWEVLKTTDRNYTVFTHVWDVDNHFAGQWDNEPVNGEYHTSWFGAGEIIEDEYRIPIQGDAVPGTYALQVGWYDRATDERLPLGGGTETALKLGSIQIYAKDE